MIRTTSCMERFNLKKFCMNVLTHVNILVKRIIYCVYILTAFPVKFSAESTTQHWLFYKEHSVREKNASKPSNRTLFIINVPQYCSEVIKLPNTKCVLYV